MKPPLLLACLLAPLAMVRAETTVIRVGYFPNVTHAQGVIGSETTRQGRGWFEQRLGPGVKVQWYAFNAGPSAMESLFAGSIDLTYVGPNPALNAYIRSKGEEIRILAGAAEGGAALVVHDDGNLRSAADFRGKRIATPQFGNTQDIAARAWLHRQGFKVTPTGGDVSVVPIANPDQLGLFQRHGIDAVWTVEPWVSRLEMEGPGRIFLEQNDAVTTVLVVRAAFLRDHPALAAAFAATHRELTAWINAHPAEAQALVGAGISATMHRQMPAALVAHAWRRLHFTDRIPRAQVAALVSDAQRVGFLRDAIALDRLFSGKP